MCALRTAMVQLLTSGSGTQCKKNIGRATTPLRCSSCTRAQCFRALPTRAGEVQTISRMLFLSYDERLVPEGGVLLAASVATLTKSHTKDPAGHAFHELALKQAGLYGAAGVPPRCSRAIPLRPAPHALLHPC